MNKIHVLCPQPVYSCIELNIIHQVGTLSHPSFQHSKVHFVILDNFMQYRHYLNFLPRGGKTFFIVIFYRYFISVSVC